MPNLFKSWCLSRRSLSATILRLPSRPRQRQRLWRHLQRVFLLASLARSY